MFLPVMNFGHFGPPALLQDVRVLPPPEILANFGPISTLSAVRSTFLAEEEAQNLEFLPHPKFWPFLGRPLKDVLPAPSPHNVHCLLCLPTQIKQQRKTLADKQYSPCFLVKTSPAEGGRRFHKNMACARLGVWLFRCLGGSGFRCVFGV